MFHSRYIQTIAYIVLVYIFLGAAIATAANKREKTLILMHGGGQGQWTDVGIGNPYATGYSHQQGNSVLLEPLFYYSAFSGKMIPWLAESYTYNSNFTELTVKIRKGAAWSDGHSFTARDVAFTINMLKTHAPLLRNSAEIKEWVKGIQTPDDQTVIFSFNSPQPRFQLSHLSYKFDTGLYFVPEHVFQGIEDPASFTFFDPAKGWPLATGGYKISTWTPQQKLFERRDDWWAVRAGVAKLPQVERILFVPWSDESRATQMIIRNQVDMTIDLRPATINEAVKQNPKVITHTLRNEPFGYVDWWPLSLWFNCSEPPFSTKEVRWAISYAIDRDQLIDVAYEGAGLPTQLPLPAFSGLQPFIDATADLLKKYPTNEFNKKKSASLMTKQGYKKDTKGFWVKNGKRVTPVIHGFSIFDDIGPILAEQLRRAGFEANYTAPVDSYTKITEGTAKAMIFGHGGSIADPFATMDFFTSKYALPTGEPTQFFSRWHNAAYDTLVAEMGTLPIGDPKVKDLYLKAMSIWLEDLPDVPILQWMHRIPMNTTYWKGYPTAKNPYVNGAFWHLTFPLILQNLTPVQ